MPRHWRFLLGFSLTLLGCSRTPPFPTRWDFAGLANTGANRVAARELTPRTRRTETVKMQEATLEVVIESAEVEAGGMRGPAPVGLVLTPTVVTPGLRLRLYAVGDLELSGPPPDFFERIELATIDAKGDEKERVLVVTRATGTPGIASLRTFGH